MEAVVLTKKRFDNLTPYELPNNIYNTEASLYNFRTKDKWVTVDKLMKKFYVRTGPVFGNKLETINALIDNYSELSIPELVLPERLAIVNGEVVGYVMPLIKSRNLYTVLNDYKIDTKDKLLYLKQVGLILNKMEQIRKHSGINDFYLNDLHEHNFVITPDNQVKAVDLDSCKINYNEVFPSRYLSENSLASHTIDITKKYELTDSRRCNGYIKPDEETDMYCYIMMIINFLYGHNISTIEIEEFYNYLSYLESIKIDHELITSFENIVLANHNTNPCELLETIDDTMLGKSRTYHSLIKKRKIN